MTKGRAKGLLFNHLRDWVRDQRGPDAWEAALARATDREREIYGGLVLASSWQPVAAWNVIVDAVFAADVDPNDGMRRFCAHLGEQELNTIVRMVLKFGSPGFMLRRTGFLWSRYFDTGKFGAEELDDTHWRLWLDGPADPETTAGRLTCANGPGPWLEQGLALSGRPGRVIHVRCRYDGHPRCELEARW